MHKYVPLTVVALLVLCGLEAVAYPVGIETTALQVEAQKKILSPLTADVLDQQQPAYDFFGPVGPGPLWDFLNYIVAQTFTPTKSVLTRVELLLAKNITTTYDYTVVIRESPNGADLTMVSVPAEQITTDNFSWIEFDFPDIAVAPGNSYYLISYTENVTDNFYGWGLTLTDTYPNGTVFYTVNDGVNWTEESDGDMTFKTYGRENVPPNEPLIMGDIEGKFGVEYPYNFSTDDLDGDEVYYWIDWGDGTPVLEWIGPYASGEVVIVKHTYKKRGTYTISAKAKDPHGAESPWGYLEVTMPVSTSWHPVFFLQRFFENHPRAFPLIRHLLG